MRVVYVFRREGKVVSLVGSLAPVGRLEELAARLVRLVTVVSRVFSILTMSRRVWACGSGGGGGRGGWREGGRRLQRDWSSERRETERDMRDANKVGAERELLDALGLLGVGSCRSCWSEGQEIVISK